MGRVHQRALQQVPSLRSTLSPSVKEEKKKKKIRERGGQRKGKEECSIKVIIKSLAGYINCFPQNEMVCMECFALETIITFETPLLGSIFKLENGLSFSVIGITYIDFLGQFLNA